MLGRCAPLLLVLLHPAAALTAVSEGLLAVEAHQSRFLHPLKDPNWNGSSLQDQETYRSDYPKDDNSGTYRDGRQHGGGGGHAHGSRGSSSSDSSAEGRQDHHEDAVQPGRPGSVHTEQWYRDKCTELKLNCEERKEEAERMHARRIRRLEEEYRHLTKILDGAQGSSDEARSSVTKQTKIVTKYEKRVEEARTVYKRNERCQEELEELEEDLERLQSDPNDSEEDIDAECQKRKEILKTQKCVDEFFEARETLRRSETSYREETSELSEDEAAAKGASKALKPIKEQAEAARRRLEEAREEGRREQETRIQKQCDEEMKNLLRFADEEVHSMQREYRRHQKTLTRKEEEYTETSETVEEQTTRVTEEKRRVEEAKKVYEQKKNCAKELERLEEELDRLQSNPNESDDDIDEECQKKKDIFNQKKCVDELAEARYVMSRAESEYSAEETELRRHRHSSRTVRTVVESYRNSLKEFEEAVEMARASRRALRECAKEELPPSALQQEEEEDGVSAAEDDANAGRSDATAASANVAFTATLAAVSISALCRSS